AMRASSARDVRRGGKARFRLVTAPQYREGAPPAKEAALEHFRFSSNHGNALFPCFHAIPGKSASRFVWQNRGTLLLESL
ncbi:hypothetical protein ACCS96_41875, partial [Rhizobium ruizarguesonis]